MSNYNISPQWKEDVNTVGWGRLSTTDGASLWNFDALDGWTAQNATLSLSSGVLTITPTTTDPILRLVPTAIDGSTYTTVRVRIRRAGGAIGQDTEWNGTCFYRTAAHGESGSYRKFVDQPTWTADFLELDFDMTNLTAGGTDWVDNVITGLRLDFTNGSTFAFEVDSISVIPSNEAWTKLQYLIKKSVNAGKLYSTDVVSTYSLVYNTTGAYVGGVLSPNGDIHFVPRNATVGQKISSDGIVSTYSLIDLTSIPTFVVGTNYNLSDGATFAYPSGIVSGDFIIISQSDDSYSTTPNSPTDASSTSYSELVRFTGDVPDYLISYKFADGTESGTNVTIDRGGQTKGAAVIQVFRNVDKTTIFDTPYTTSSGGSGDPDAPSITTITNNSLVVAVGFLDDDSGVTVTVPSGYSNLNYGESSAGSGSDSVAMMASKLVPTAGAENPPVFSTTGDDAWQAVTIALRPLTVSTDKYIGGVLAPNGDIHFIPHSSDRGQKVSPSGIVSTYSLVYTTTTAYIGGVVAPNGDIHFAPFSANRGQKISAAGVVSTYSLINSSGTYFSGVLAPNGDIHFIPTNAPVGQKISAAGVVSTYSLVYTTSTGAYYGGVVAANGDIHFVPGRAAVGQKISSTGVVSTYSLVYTTSGGAYMGGVLAPNGDIHFIPRTAAVGQKVSSTGVVSTYNLAYAANDVYWGGVLTPSGDIHFVPYNANRGQKIHTNSAIPFEKGLALSPWVNKF